MTEIQQWNLSKDIGDIIESNCKEIPYEGTEVNKGNMERDLYEYVTLLLQKKEDDKKCKNKQ